MPDSMADTLVMTMPTTDEPKPPAAEETAPRGRRADGAPRRKPGPRKGSPQRGGRARKPAAPDYRPGILGMFQLVALPLSFTAPVDAASVSLHAPAIAEAINELAKERPEVAAALDRVLQVGPYGALIAAVLPLGVQLAHNHGLLPESAAVQLGAHPRREILASLGIDEERQDVDHAAPTAA